MKFIDLSNKKFNRLLVLRRALKTNKSKSIYWKCKCDCGNIHIVAREHLLNNGIKSCGCKKKEGNSFIHGMTNTKFYNIWSSLKHRCNNKKYKNYGGRGIIYDLKWENFLGFKEDMYFKYIYAKKKYGEECLSIERIDVNGNYCFDNCIFIPAIEQQNNTRKNKYFIAISPEGKKYKRNNQRDFAKLNNLSQGNIHSCLYGRYKQTKGWKFLAVI